MEAFKTVPRMLEGKLAIITGGARGEFDAPFSTEYNKIIRSTDEARTGLGAAIARNLASIRLLDHPQLQDLGL